MQAAQIVRQEVVRWLENPDYSRFADIQRLEQQSRVWEYGKWAAQGRIRSGVPGQIDYRASRSEPTAWDAVGGISDDEAMRIHAATLALPSTQRRILDLVYVQWLPLESARAAIQIRRDTFHSERRAMLESLIDSQQTY